MKTLFSNRQLAHVWANQTQEHGRGSNMFFEGKKIWSYGYHYLAAEIHKVKGKTFALVNSENYSNTTAKHLSCIRSGLHQLMPYFSCSNPGDLKTAVKELDARAQESIDLALKRSKVTSSSDLSGQFDSIHYAFKQASLLRKILGKAEKWPTEKQLAAVQKHLEARLDRYRELNTPEIIAAKKAKVEKQKQIEQAKALADQQERIEKFRKGESVGSINLPYEILRIKGDVIQTSRGAEVPLSKAITLARDLVEGKGEGLILGQAKINGFQLHDISPIENDLIISIGCHRILLSEVKSVVLQIA